jgi:rare lipoprotein A
MIVATSFSLHAGEIAISHTDFPVQNSFTTLAKSKWTVGIATYYHNRYNGRRTSSGAVYNSQKLTAAHPYLPHGTRLKVINLTNNRSVIVTINDRCRKRKFEFIDLSRAAARKLRFIKEGTARVCIQLLESREG